MDDSSDLPGTIHGKTIELETETGLPEGQRVIVSIIPCPDDTVPGAGIRDSFGGWSDDPEGLEEFLAWTRDQRKSGRSRVDP